MYELKWIAGGGVQAGLRAESIARSNRYSRAGWILVGVMSLTVLALSTVLRQRVSPAPRLCNS